MALVGESGCGKSTLGRTLINLLPPVRGTVTFEGKELTGMSRKAFAPYRRQMQLIFQDPYASLDPRMTVRDIVAEPLIIHGLAKTRQETDKKVIDLLRRVGLDDYHANRYPHEFSGGQRQRIGIARALAVQPQLIIARPDFSALTSAISLMPSPSGQ